MTRVVSATQARIRFGELMHQVAETNEPITVERDGRPCVVILSVEAYHRLKDAQARPPWQDILSQVRDFRTHLQARRSGRPLPPYDAHYLALTERLDAEFWTADAIRANHAHRSPSRG